MASSLQSVWAAERRHDDDKVAEAHLTRLSATLGNNELMVDIKAAKVCVTDAHCLDRYPLEHIPCCQSEYISSACGRK